MENAVGTSIRKLCSEGEIWLLCAACACSNKKKSKLKQMYIFLYLFGRIAEQLSPGDALL